MLLREDAERERNEKEKKVGINKSLSGVGMMGGEWIEEIFWPVH